MTTLVAPPLAGPPPGTVDVWLVPVRGPDVPHERLRSVLSEDEHAHAARLRVGREAWTAAHGALRLILAHYLGTPAAELGFQRTKLGKPRLAGRETPHFNLSWRDGLALVAVARDRAVGADLEREHDEAEIEALTREFLSPLDATAIDRAGPDGRRAAFFAAWTRHEARRKLHGLGIEDTLPAPAPGGVVLVRALNVPAGYAAAIAAEGSGWLVRERELAEAL